MISMRSLVTRYADFSIRRSLAGHSVEIGSVGAARSMLMKRMPLRHLPLVALLRSALRHRVMIVADGTDWRRTHEAVLPHFSASVVASSYAPVVRAVAGDCLDALLSGSPAPAEAQLDSREIDVEEVMRTITVSVMGHVLFGQALPLAEAQEIERLLSEATRSFDDDPCARINRGVGIVSRWLRLGRWQPALMPRPQRRAVRRLLAWIRSRSVLADPAAALSPLQHSLWARYAALGDRRARTCVAAECAMFFIAGIETTAAALTFAIAEIADNAALQADVSKEARAGRGCSDPGSPTSRFPLIHRVVRETLRRHTIVPTMVREAETDYRATTALRGSDAPKEVAIRRGTILRYLPVLGHMRRRVWHDPHRFEPERFARPLTPDQRKHYHPFGIGPQACPGQSLATTECILVLQAFFERFDVEPRERAGAIAVTRNVVHTNRPVEVRVRITTVSELPGCMQARRQPPPDSACPHRPSAA